MLADCTLTMRWLMRCSHCKISSDDTAALFNVCMKYTKTATRARDENAFAQILDEGVDEVAEFLEEHEICDLDQILLIIGSDTKDDVLIELALFARILSGTDRVRVSVVGTAAPESSSIFADLEREEPPNVRFYPEMPEMMSIFILVICADKDMAPRAHELTDILSSPVLAMDAAWWKLPSGQELRAVKPRSNGGWKLAHAWLDDGSSRCTY